MLVTCEESSRAFDAVDVSVLLFHCSIDCCFSVEMVLSSLRRRVRA